MIAIKYVIRKPYCWYDQFLSSSIRAAVGGQRRHRFQVRPVRPDDEPLLAAFHKTLTEPTVYDRYAQILPLDRRIAHERLAKICSGDYDHQMVLLAIEEDFASEQLAAVAQLINLDNTQEAEFAIVASDNYQGVGLGSHLLRQLIMVGRAEKLHRIIGQISAPNSAMLTICLRIGFRIVNLDPITRLAVLDL